MYYNADTEAFAVPPNFRISAGQSTSPRSLYLFRPEENTQDGSLGIRPFNDTTGLPHIGGGVFIGAPIQNNTGVALTSFSLGYTGIQWWIRTGGQNTFVVSYSTDATSLGTGGWTEIPALQYSAPFFGFDGGIIDSTDPDNRTDLAPVEVTLATTLEPGETIWVRWFGENVGGIDQSISIDNVRFTAVPEPSAWALAAGLLFLGLAGLSRLRKKRN